MIYFFQNPQHSFSCGLAALEFKSLSEIPQSLRSKLPCQASLDKEILCCVFNGNSIPNTITSLSIYFIVLLSTDQLISPCLSGGPTVILSTFLLLENFLIKQLGNATIRLINALIQSDKLLLGSHFFLPVLFLFVCLFAIQAYFL